MLKGLVLEMNINNASKCKPFREWQLHFKNSAQK